MTFLGLIKVIVAFVGGIGVGMALKDRVANGVKRGMDFFKEIKDGFYEGEMSADSDCVTKRPGINDGRSEQVSEASVVDAKDTEIFKLKDRVVALERENGRLKRDNEVLRVKLDEVQGKIEVSFPKLVKRLYCMSCNPEIKAILEENGLSFYTNFADFPDGFMRIKNGTVTEAVLVRAALVRGDDLVEPGIVHVPMSEAGAAAPKSSCNQGVPTENASVESLAACEGAKPEPEIDDKENFCDDFVVG